MIAVLTIYNFKIAVLGPAVGPILSRIISNFS
eukprot:CAMPEP_0184647096 /NCGR_PEP_ID=MMETSP0308-20130426/3995_1 /TAXON_ID=38269 /ORGANISM="Gloeochaete witrockiana, Strain SAG 46.84" /LENGTH=31 /DNA_ID= /DNA_START= /DNA_END= /DNA_ORIENTATION=